MVSSAACAFVAAPVEAQQAAASLRGTITDNGQPAGTQVAAVNVDTGYRRVSPISNGAYHFAALLPGRYRLEVTTANGMRQTDVFTLAVAQNAELSFDLSQGQAAAAAQQLADGQNVVLSTLQNKLNSSSGVNIDEEMAHLLSLQNAYSANARVMSTVKDMFDSLLQSM